MTRFKQVCYASFGVKIGLGFLVGAGLCIIAIGACGNMDVDDLMPGSDGPAGQVGLAGTSPFALIGDDAVYLQGNVGIGTDSPTERLEVTGNAKVNGTVFADAFSSNSPLQLQTAGETRIFVDDATGNIGIGTTTPQSRLAIGGPPGPDDSAFSMTITTPASGNHRVPLKLYRQSTTSGQHLQGWYSDAGDGTENEVARLTANGSFYVGLKSGRVGIRTTSPDAVLHVAGDILATVGIHTNGSVTADFFCCSSDGRYKKNVEPLDGALVKVKKLRPVEYDWNREAFPDRKFSDRRQIGLIAQELRDVVPEAVYEDSNGYMSVDYGRLTPLLIRAVHELREEKDAQIDALRAELAALRGELRAINALVQVSQ